STDVIEGVKFGSVSWSPDGRSFYYSWLPVDPSIPPAGRNGYMEVRFHRLGSDPKRDEIIRPKTGDPKLFQHVELSRDGKYLFHVVSHGWSENELFLKRIGVDREFKPFAKGHNTRFEVDAWKDHIYVVTDEGAPNRHVFKCPGARPERQAWKEIVPEDKGATLEDLTIVGGHLLTRYVKNAASELRITGLDGKGVRAITLPDIGAVSRPNVAEDPLSTE